MIKYLKNKKKKTTINLNKNNNNNNNHHHYNNKQIIIINNNKLYNRNNKESNYMSQVFIKMEKVAKYLLEMFLNLRVNMIKVKNYLILALL